MANGGAFETTARRVVLAHEPAIRVGPLTIAPALRQLVHTDGRDEIVEPKVMEVLVVLLRAQGRIITRDELCAAAWNGRIVGDDAINRVLSRLRRLSEGIGAGVFAVETITKVGYRLVAPAPVEAAAAGPITAPAVSAPPSPADAAPEPLAAAASMPALPASATPARSHGTVAPRGVDRRSAIAGGVALAAVAAGFGGWRFWRGTGGTDDSVAVLPFANLSGDPAQAYFSDGIAEELRSALARIVRLKVAARTSSELMRDTDAATAAEKLGVGNIVIGSVRRGNGTIRVGAQLIDGATGLMRWSDSYDRAAGDVLAIEAGIAENVANALNIVLGRAEKALLSVGGTSNPVAHDAYLRGAAFEAGQKPFAALPEYAAAVAADPNYALALAGHASISCWLAIQFTTHPERALVLAAAEARRAVALAPQLGVPYGILGFILYAHLNFRGANDAFATAMRLAPNDAFLLGRYSIYLGAVGRADAAVRLVERAQRLDPLRPNGPFLLGLALYQAGRFADALVPLRQAVARLPDDIEGKNALASTLILIGQPAEGLAVALTIPPGNGFRESLEALARAKLSDRAAANAALDRLRTMDAMQYSVAQVHAQRGETDAAFAALDRAVAGSETDLAALKGDPMMRPLHGDPRYAALLRRIGFP